MEDRAGDRRRVALLAGVAAAALVVTAGVAAVVVTGPLQAAQGQLAGMVGTHAAREAIRDASLRLLAAVPLLMLVTAAVLVGPVRDWARRRTAVPPDRVDPLTGLATRLALTDRLAHAVASSGRHGGTVAVCFLDLDGFAAFNARATHDGGDRALIQLAARLTHAARRTDLVCRVGGDELVVVAEHLEGESGAAVVADKLLATLREPIQLDTGSFPLTAAMGVAVCPHDSDDPDELLALARGAMQAARAEGGTPTASRPSTCGPGTSCGRPRSATCARRWRATSWSWPTSRRSTCGRARSSAPRRCCGGSATATGRRSRRASSSP